MKTFILGAVLLLGSVAQLKAQRANTFRFDIQLGYASSVEGGDGALVTVEPKWVIEDNMNVGFRISAAILSKDITLGGTISDESEIGANTSYLGTYDYFFNNGSSSFAPFVGAGLGYYQVANIEISTNDDTIEEELESDGKFGGMLRTGFDWGKFRLAFEYNLVGDSELRDPSNTVVGDAKNSYYGVALGFYFGGGKWKNQNRRVR